MTMITDYGWGYMTAKKKSRGGRHIADFNCLALTGGVSKGFRGWFHITAPKTLAILTEYGQFLFEGHQYISDPFKPPFIITNGAQYTMDVVKGH